jgi:hypothetical protein
MICLRPSRTISCSMAASVTAVVCLLTAALLVYAPVLKKLIFDWWSLPDYSHGLICGPAAVVLAWNRRDQLRRTPVAARSVALLGIAAAMLLRSREHEATVGQGRRRHPRETQDRSCDAPALPVARVRCRHLHRARQLLVAGARLQDTQPVRVPVSASSGVLREQARSRHHTRRRRRIPGPPGHRAEALSVERQSPPHDCERPSSTSP